jgi:hypothetical protein
MFIIPYITSKNENVIRFYIFLNQGKLFINMEIYEIDDFCIDNDIYYEKKDFKEDYCYLKISNKTNLKQFYSYTENSNAECWRTFILFENDCFNVNSTNPEFIQPILTTILTLL